MTARLNGAFDMMMKPTVTVLCLVLLTSCASRRSSELAHTHEDPDEVKRIMRETIIPNVDFRKAHVCDAIDFLMDASVKHHPQHRGIGTVFSMSRGIDAAPPDAPFQESVADRGPDVTVVAENMTYLQLLEEICRQADLVWKITHSKLVITPRNQ